MARGKQTANAAITAAIKESTMPNPATKGKGLAYQFLLDHVHHRGRECVIWKFAHDNAGYGMLGVNSGHYRAHRLMCRMAHGEPPTPKHQAAHECGNRNCVNPVHLSWKTNSENQRDSVKHGTASRKPGDRRFKLTAADVVKIRAMKGQKPHAEIAEMFGVSRDAIDKVIAGISWKDGGLAMRRAERLAQGA